MRNISIEIVLMKCFTVCSGIFVCLDKSLHSIQGWARTPVFSTIWDRVDKPARLTIRVLWFLFLIVRRVPRPSESGCKKCNGLKKYLLGHTFSWKRLSAILCPWNPPWWWFFSLKLNKKCLKTPSKIKGLTFISSNLGNMDFFLIFNCISH